MCNDSIPNRMLEELMGSDQISDKERKLFVGMAVCRENEERVLGINKNVLSELDMEYINNVLCR